MIARPIFISAVAFGLFLASVILWGPKRDHIAVVSDPRLVEVFEHGGFESPIPIVLQVPQEFRYGSSVGRQKTWGISILTFYPSFTSPRDPANIPYNIDSGCKGYCNGRILISVGNHIGNVAYNHSASSIDLISEVRIKDYERKSPNKRVLDLEAQFGFDRVFDVELISRDSRPDPEHSWIMRHLLRSSRDKASYDLVASCSMSTPYHACEVFFPLACNPGIRVEVNGWLYEYLRDVWELQRRVDQFISAMVKQPKCEF